MISPVYNSPFPDKKIDATPNPINGTTKKFIAHARLMNRKFVAPFNTPLRGTSKSNKNTRNKMLGSIDWFRDLPVSGDKTPSPDPNKRATNNKLVV